MFQMGELQSTQESAVKEVLSQLQETANVVTAFKDKFGKAVAESDKDKDADLH